MLRKLTWMSGALLIATLLYWAIAHQVRTDLRSLGGNDRFPTASLKIGRFESAWLVSRSGILLWYAYDRVGGNLPLIGRYGFIDTLFKRLTWPAGSDLAMRPIGIGSVKTAECTGLNGSPVDVCYVYLHMDRLAVLFALLPAIRGLWLIAWRAPRRWRFYRAARMRRWRNRLGLCSGCGFDLRQSANRCPECGRVVRTIRVSLPPRPKRRRLAA